jgi:hypothetical protein
MRQGDCSLTMIRVYRQKCKTPSVVNVDDVCGVSMRFANRLLMSDTARYDELHEGLARN